MQAEERESRVTDSMRQPPETGLDQKATASRDAAVQRRAMQAATAAAVIGLRSHGGRRVDWRRPPGGYV